MEKLTQFCIDNNISSAQVSGIGAVRNIDIGVYDINKKDYHHKLFEEIHELISFQGNIAFKDGEPFVHTHVTFSNTEYNVFGGHLFDAKITATGEILLSLGDSKIDREYNENIGIYTWCLYEKH